MRNGFRFDRNALSKTDKLWLALVFLLSVNSVWIGGKGKGYLSTTGYTAVSGELYFITEEFSGFLTRLLLTKELRVFQGGEDFRFGKDVDLSFVSLYSHPHFNVLYGIRAKENGVSLSGKEAISEADRLIIKGVIFEFKTFRGFAQEGELNLRKREGSAKRLWATDEKIWATLMHLSLSDNSLCSDLIIFRGAFSGEGEKATASLSEETLEISAILLSSPSPFRIKKMVVKRGIVECYEVEGVWVF